MKLNIAKVGMLYSAVVDGKCYKFGFYDSGKAFIAHDDDIMTFAEAYKKFIPKRSYVLCNSFYVNNQGYDKNLSGIVKYLIDKYCR